MVSLTTPKTDPMELVEDQAKTTTKSIASSVASTKKIFRYNELLKVNKDTPRSEFQFISICRPNSMNQFDIEHPFSYDSVSEEDTDCAKFVIDTDSTNRDTTHWQTRFSPSLSPRPRSYHTDDISNVPVVSLLMETNDDSATAADPPPPEGQHYETAKSIHLDDTLNQCNIDELVREGDYAISVGVLPQRIHQGSSGSYFVKNVEQHVIAVFKPKNEEPYGHLNPKWLKWMHKTCLPCCFGRSCILPNQGYLSEVGASVVDSYLGTGIVPKTTIAWLSSATFNYGRIDRSNLRAKRLLSKSMPNAVCKKIKCELPPKVGSYQQFVNGYMPSSLFLTKINDAFFQSKLGVVFLEKFQKMTILDYFIRNTDRGNDNWLLLWGGHEGLLDTPFFWENCRDVVNGGMIELAAIDNGLAFPFKHPDSWRSYPFLWAWLPCAKIPFLDSIIETFLPKLTSLDSIDDLVCRLRALFSIDKGFSENRFEDQMAVMKGQIYNICNAFRNGMSPFEMVKLNPIYIRSQEAWDTVSISDENLHKKHPLFSCI